MARKKGNKDSKVREKAFVEMFVKDIKALGVAYIKSPRVAAEVKALDPDIQIVWCEEDRTYTAYYNKDYKGE